MLRHACNVHVRKRIQVWLLPVCDGSALTVPVILQSAREAVFYKHAVLQDPCSVATSGSVEHGTEGKRSKKEKKIRTEMCSDYNHLSTFLLHSDNMPLPS